MNEPRWVTSKSPSGRVQPAWVPYFLRALERTGEVRAAAADAGIDHTTAYGRRKAHAEFAQGWDAALRTHARAKARAEEEEIEALRQGPSTIRSAANGPPPPVELGEDLVVAGSQLKRAGHGRWSKAKERIFFEELAATANVRRAAEAAGVSKSAVLARRLRHPLFRAKWEAVVQTAKASIDLYVVEAAKKTFDPDELGTGEVEPKVTVAEAIKIAQSGGSKAQRGEGQQSWQEEAEAMSADAVEAMREGLIAKLRRMRERDLAAGWSLDERYGVTVPPGWVKGPDYRPKAPGPGSDCDDPYG